MPKQIVTLRLDEDDLACLAAMQISGASNLSEKIRAVLAEARAQREGLKDYAVAYDYARSLYRQPERGLSEAAVRSGLRSELVHRVIAWLPETTAFVLSSAGAGSGDERDQATALRRVEQGLGERALGLVDSLLQLADAGFPGCLQQDVLRNRAQSALALRQRAAPQSKEQGHE